MTSENDQRRAQARPSVVRLTLTMQQIKDLAESAGMLVDSSGYGADEMEGEYAISECPAAGLLNDGEPGEPDSFSHYSHIVYCLECPEEGCIGLGPEIEAPATTPQPQGDASPNPDDEASIDKAWQRFQAAVATPQAALAKQTYCLACEYEGPDTGGPCPRCDAPRTRPLTPQARTSADRNAYEGAREDLLDWKGRALRAESRLRSLGWQGVDASEAPAQHTEAPNG